MAADGKEWQAQQDKFRSVISLVMSQSARPRSAQELTFAAIRGLLAALDPHSYFLDSLSLRSLSEDQEGNYFGIGIRVSKYEDRLTVLAPIEGTPAYRAGILPGDVIVAINGAKTSGLGLEEAMGKLRGPRGSWLSLLVLRPSSKEELSFNLRREKIPLSSLAYSFVLPQHPAIGYIRLRLFGRRTVAEMQEQLAPLCQQQHIRGLILDLRLNPGGSFPAALDMADLFLAKGQPLVIVRGRDKQETKYARKNGQYEELPLVVLINHGSASAAEIVASALQYHKRAVIVGSRSWGKGLVETLNVLPLDTAVALTTARYCDPQGRCLQRDYAAADLYFSEEAKNGGVVPDVPVADAAYPPRVNRWLARGYFFAYALELQRGGFSVNLGFQADEHMLSGFSAFLRSRHEEIDTGEWPKLSADLRTELTRQLLTLYFSATEGMKALLATDPVVDRAAAILEQGANDGRR
jgi:carboxyl-terminal processing protease